MDNILRERRLRWLGHVFRMDHKRIPQQALYWQVPGYKRGPGRPRANWRGVVSKDLQKMGFTWKEAEVAALDRHGWRRSVAQCVQLDTGWIKVKVYSLLFYVFSIPVRFLTFLTFFTLVFQVSSSGTLGSIFKFLCTISDHVIDVTAQANIWTSRLKGTMSARAWICHRQASIFLGGVCASLSFAPIIAVNS